MTPQQKAWGVNTPLYFGDCAEVHHASIKKGGQSSVHTHEHKSNMFYVVSGELSVDTFPGSHKDGDLEESVALKLSSTGQRTCTIGPGEWHQFRAVTDVELIEIYTPIPPRPNDIKRSE